MEAQRTLSHRRILLIKEEMGLPAKEQLNMHNHSLQSQNMTTESILCKFLDHLCSPCYYYNFAVEKPVFYPD